MSALAILTKCPLAKCPLAKCRLAKCPLAKCLDTVSTQSGTKINNRPMCDAI